jgi:hypothetical protein
MSCGHNHRSLFPSLCDKKNVYKHISDFEWLQSYDCLKIKIEVKDYLKE